ncbi:MAG: SRPBCC family protein [Pedobacter sp.]|nr:SRPBCC family protein [Pedobacter sp.]
MKALKIILGIILVLVIIFFVGGLFLPKTYSVNRSTVINAPDSVIYKNISSYDEFLKWNPWSKMEPNIKTTVAGPVGQPGHMYTWVGDKTGSGQMTIKSAEPNKMVDMELKFIKPFESLADARFDLAAEGTGQKVTWTMSGENDGTFSKWMCLMMDGMVGKDFEAGLKSLKEKSEKGQ